MKRIYLQRGTLPLLPKPVKSLDLRRLTPLYLDLPAIPNSPNRHRAIFTPQTVIE